jgi:hypothetical protein
VNDRPDAASAAAPGSTPPRTRRDLFGVAIVAALVALALAFGAQRGRRAVPVASRIETTTLLAGALGRYILHPASGRIEIATTDGSSRLDLELSLVIDDVERPLVLRQEDVRRHDEARLSAELPMAAFGDHAEGTLELRMDPASDLLTTTLTVDARTDGPPHTYALRLAFVQDGRELFVPGVGMLGDPGTTDARAVVIDDDVHPFALLSAQGAVSVVETPPDAPRPSVRPRVVVTTRAETASRRAGGLAAKTARLDVGVVVGASTQMLWGRLYKLLRIATGRVSGVVTGTEARAHVLALDEDGLPRIRALTDEGGRFVVEAPVTANHWYAALEATHTSAPVRFVPATPWDLRLDVSLGGELQVRVIDADTSRPVIARLFVKGIEGTLDPTFGPDHRASGAGPLMDMREGEVTTPLPAGRYRVSATKGIEWSIDAEVVEVTSGRLRRVDLALRHVVPTPGMVGCDLHVHARPSFDSPVTPEDRVLSLLSAGVDFAVPTEHNLVGNYGPALEVLRLSGKLAHVPGVEVTTFNPRFGHFGVFPYPVGAQVPQYRGTSPAQLVTSAHRADPNRMVVVHHPRLPSGIGYFHVAHFDPKTGKIPAGMRTDFDAVEIYNGYDLGNRKRVEEVMEDWFSLLNLGARMAATGSSDSHRIQYQWAGYPRTMALVDPRSAGDMGQPVDPMAVVASLKSGRSFVTNGPILELELADGSRTARPGDEMEVTAEMHARLRVRAPPWMDITQVEIVAGDPGGAAKSHVVVHRAAVSSRPTETGKEVGSLAQAAARTVRYEADLALALPEGARWVVAIARGERRMDDALAFMPVQPFAFTNPVWLAPAAAAPASAPAEAAP